jgi:hypothetical protein
MYSEKHANFVGIRLAPPDQGVAWGRELKSECIWFVCSG